MIAFIDRMCAVYTQVAVALISDPLATIADSVAWLPLLVAVVALCRLIVRVEKWIARWLDVHRMVRDFEQLLTCSADVETTEAQHRPRVTGLGHPTPPPPARPAISRRRMPGVRIPGRPSRRAHSNSKRKARS